MKKRIRVLPVVAAGALLCGMVWWSGCSDGRTVRSGDITVELTAAGEIGALKIDGQPVEGFTARTGIVSGTNSKGYRTDRSRNRSINY